MFKTKEDGEMEGHWRTLLEKFPDGADEDEIISAVSKVVADDYIHDDRYRAEYGVYVQAINDSIAERIQLFLNEHNAPPTAPPTPPVDPEDMRAHVLEAVKNIDWSEHTSTHPDKEVDEEKVAATVAGHLIEMDKDLLALVIGDEAYNFDPKEVLN